jgi:rare lipoprotein A
MKIDRLIRYAVAILLLVFLRTGTTSPRPLQPIPKPVPMIASFYGAGFDGHPTASGTTFRRAAFTAAHRTLPFGTRLVLTNPKTRRSVTVEVTDRGPYSELDGIKYFEGVRDLDVSEAAARVLGFEREGVAMLSVQLVPLASP